MATTIVEVIKMLESIESDEWDRITAICDNKSCKKRIFCTMSVIESRTHDGETFCKECWNKLKLLADIPPEPLQNQIY